MSWSQRILEAANALDGSPSITRRNDAPAASWLSNRLTNPLEKCTASQLDSSRQCTARLSSSCVNTPTRLVSSAVGAKSGDERGEGAGAATLHPHNDPI